MTTFTHITCEQLNAERDQWTLVDIRDRQSFELAHVEGAIAIDNDNVAQFLSETSNEQPVAVMCYHGISSQQAAAFLNQQGLQNVATVDGGFEYWRQHFAVTTEK
ncbi:thiosulfate sulfurtransferase GlpE [Alteromonas sediminis]|uniref:Thiosulfate sulfurtransferase GlpE n=1 Tax=Alteromonas sediminis TaxID=2259342 RepID=A0A3N5XY15_9ALTE|nr:thiosulfate sulfurtransferase GlpE [Alteromonas sediminis]RPJ65450.1 thiosulfate sulfurtransferase GlpE [Alteromonas sediminis]